MHHRTLLQTYIRDLDHLIQRIQVQKMDLQLRVEVMDRRYGQMTHELHRVKSRIVENVKRSSSSSITPTTIYQQNLYDDHSHDGHGNSPPNSSRSRSHSNVSHATSSSDDEDSLFMLLDHGENYHPHHQQQQQNVHSTFQNFHNNSSSSNSGGRRTPSMPSFFSSDPQFTQNIFNNNSNHSHSSNNNNNIYFQQNQQNYQQHDNHTISSSSPSPVNHMTHVSAAMAASAGLIDTCDLTLNHELEFLTRGMRMGIFGGNNLSHENDNVENVENFDRENFGASEEREETMVPSRRMEKRRNSGVIHTSVVYQSRCGVRSKQMIDLLSVTLLPSVSKVISGSSDGYIHIWDISQSGPCENDGVNGVNHDMDDYDVMSDEGRRYSHFHYDFGSMNGKSRRKSGGGQRRRNELSCPEFKIRAHSGWVRCMTSDPDGHYVVTGGGGDHKIHLYSLNHDDLSPLSSSSSSSSLTSSPSFVFSSSSSSMIGRRNNNGNDDDEEDDDDEVAYVETVRDGLKQKAIFEGHSGGITCVQADLSAVISGSVDRTMKLWDIGTGKCVSTMHGHKSYVKTLQFFAYALASGGGCESEIKLWDIRSAKCVRRLFGHHHGVSALHFNDQKLVSGGRCDGLIKVFDLRMGALLDSISLAPYANSKGGGEFANGTHGHSSYPFNDGHSVVNSSRRNSFSSLYSVYSNGSSSGSSSGSGSGSGGSRSVLSHHRNSLPLRPRSVSSSYEATSTTTAGHQQQYQHQQQQQQPSGDEWSLHQAANQPTQTVTCLRFQNDKLIFGAKGLIGPVLYDMKTKSPVKQFLGHSSHINDLDFTRNCLITASRDLTVKVWREEIY